MSVSMLKSYRVILSIETSSPIHDYTGRLTKTLIYTIAPELMGLHGLRGVLTPLTISPPFTIGRVEEELGEPVIPTYERIEEYRGGEEGVTWNLKPAELNGEYIMHIGGEERIVSTIAQRLEKELTTTLAFKIDNVIARCRVEKIIDVTKSIIEKTNSASNRVRVYLKSPAQIFNVFAPTKLPKFTPSAVELLMTPYMLINNIYTINYTILINASQTLGQLVETWYSIKTLKPIMIPFKGKKEVALSGYVTYMIEATNKKTLEVIKETLAATEIAGVGRSRQNGFGTATVKA